MTFEFFDPTMDVRITAGNLPHWFQPGVTYFITFRTADSLPAEVADLWLRRRHDWLERHGIEPTKVVGTLRVPCRSTRTRSVRTTCVRTTSAPNSDTPKWAMRLHNLPAAQQREFHHLFSREFMEYLDCGYGDCVLKRPDLAKIVADTLRHDDGRSCQLGDFVVMPNHVHILARLLGETDLEKLCYSWKKYTATRIHRVLQRRGRFWQAESFDHLVRSPEQFDYLRRYIADNPAKAGLREGEYLYWRCPM